MFYNFRAGVQGLLAIDSCNYDNWKLGLDIHVSVINYIIIIYIDVFCCLINSNQSTEVLLGVDFIDYYLV